MEKQYDWIIGIGGSDMDGVCFRKFHGTKSAVKEKLVELIKEDRNNDPDEWDYGTIKLKDIEEPIGTFGLEYYGFGCYENYHIDYSAREITHIEEI